MKTQKILDLFTFALFVCTSIRWGNAENIILTDGQFGFNSCEQALSGNKSSGVYNLSVPEMNINTFKAYCLKADDNGAPWTVIQRRHKESIDFRKDWQTYKDGFGNVSGDHWLGLEKIHAFTNWKRCELWVKLLSDSDVVHGRTFDNFVIGNENEKYKVTNLGNSTGDRVPMSFCLNAEFRTFDRDVNQTLYQYGDAGFWIKPGCTNLNSQMEWSGKFLSRWDYFKYMHMAIRPIG